LTRAREGEKVALTVSDEFPQPKFEVQEQDVDERTRIIDASGEIHVSTAPEFSERLNAAIAEGKTAIVLDFSRVEFIDSTGLSVLLNGLRRLTRRQGALSVVCTNPTVLRLFEITRLDSTFDIVSTRDEALAHVAAGAAGD
jgi:anti-sigma B factor antagonist